jgi:hypothetical protein
MSLVAEKSGRTTKRVFRPKSNRIALKLRIGASVDYARWLGCFMAHVGQTEITATFREGLRLWAEASGFLAPPKR